MSFPLVGRRAAGYALALLALVGLDFALPLLMPGDPVTAFLGQDALIELSDEERRALLARYGLGDGQPLWRLYLGHLAQLLRLDFGYSLRHGMPVADLLAQHLPSTLLLVACAMALALALGVVLGIEAAFARGGLPDRLLTGATLALDGIPPFALAMGLAMVFAYSLQWLPGNGATAPFSTLTGPAAWLERARHLVLPTCAMALPAAAGVFLSARATAVALHGRPFMDFARSQGVGRFALRYRQLAPNVLAVVLSRLGGLAARLLSGAVYAETVFAYPGINLVLTDAIVKHDYPLVRGVLLATGLLLFAINLLADGLAARLARRAP